MLQLKNKTICKKIAIVIACMCIAIPSVAQQDSIGIYAVYDSSRARMDLIKYKQVKVNSAVIAGKAKLVFEGSSSQNRFKETASFLIYFGTPSINDMTKYYMFTTSYSVKDFSIGKFEVKKGNRRLTTMSYSVLGSTFGVKEVDELIVQTAKVRENVYEIRVSGPAGEYCIMPTINGISGGYAGVFDFTIE